MKTPYFLIHKKDLENGLAKLNDALKQSWGNYVIGYSYKTNGLPWIINYFKDNQCYAEVVSDDEYNLAKSICVDDSKIIYNGIAKSKNTFLDAIRNHAIVNIDSEYEIDWLDDLEKSDYRVGVRVNFDLESRYPGHEQCPDDGGRFGFCYENGELKRAIDRITSKGVTVSGIHLHKSSKTRMPEVYRAIAEVAVEIGKRYKLELSYVDIGGGFFGGLENKPQFPEYFDMVSNILREYYSSEKTILVVEPGNALVAAAVDYVTSVLDIKKSNKAIFVNTDGSRTQIDPLMTKHSYFSEIHRLSDAERIAVERQIIAGFTCMEHDRLFELLNETQILPGDKVIYHKVGAYTMCLSPLFIKWYPNVYVVEGGKVLKVREKWESEEYKSKSLEKE